MQKKCHPHLDLISAYNICDKNALKQFNFCGILFILLFSQHLLGENTQNSNTSIK